MILDDNDFLMKAMHSYDNCQCIAFDEFKEDIYRLVTIKKCITKYQQGEDINTRLVLNNFIILFNVFGDMTFKMIKYKLDRDQYPIAFPFLVLLNRLPENEIIMMDQKIIEQLRKI